MKIANKREQRQACLSFAEREQFAQSEGIFPGRATGGAGNNGHPGIDRVAQPDAAYIESQKR